MTTARLRVRVEAATAVALGVQELRLVRTDGAALPAYAPGAHIDLHLQDGLVRQYSLCGPVEDLAAYTVAVKLEPQSRGGSRAVHEKLHAGSVLEISEPRTNFPYQQDAVHSVLVAGGIGVTPLLCMARDLHRRGRSFVMHYFAGSSEQAAFADRLQASDLSQRVQLHIGLNPQQVKNALTVALREPIAGAQLYLCGPGGFMDLVRATATELGWPQDAVNLEYFKAPETVSAAGEDAPIRLMLARSGRTLTVPAGVPIIDVLREAGVEIETSCEQGVCGTCVTQVIDGVPEHRDLFLTEAEKRSGSCMAVCVSRARTTHLTLDL